MKPISSVIESIIRGQLPCCTLGVPRAGRNLPKHSREKQAKQTRRVDSASLLTSIMLLSFTTSYFLYEKCYQQLMIMTWHFELPAHTGSFNLSRKVRLGGASTPVAFPVAAVAHHSELIYEYLSVCSTLSEPITLLVTALEAASVRKEKAEIAQVVAAVKCGVPIFQGLTRVHANEAST